MPLIALYIRKRALCTAHAGKCMQPTERNRQLNKARYDVLSIPATLSKRILPVVPDMDHLCGQTMYHKAHEMLKKARNNKNGGYKKHSGLME